MVRISCAQQVESWRDGMAIDFEREQNYRRIAYWQFSVSEVSMACSNSSANRAGKVDALRRYKTESSQQNAADPALRQTGIRVMGNILWGAHICVFYETKEDLLDTAVFYFEAGLQSNEFCVWAISDPITEMDAKNALRLAVPDLDRHLAAGQIEILQGAEWYLKGDQFDLKRINRLERKAPRRIGQGLRRYEGQRQCVLD